MTRVTRQCSVLIVEDDPSLREALTDTLSLANIDYVSACDGEDAVSILSKPNNIGMVVSDINMGQMTGHDLLCHLQKSHPHIPVVLMTAYGSVKDSVDAIKQGAVDYLVKPFEPNQLVDLVNHHMVGTIKSSLNEPIAKSESSLQLLSLAKRVASSESTVLIMGESGTGKEVLARYIHQHSTRADQPFVAINCAAIPENMLEAILFGYEKGAYTGAHTSTPGKFEQANGGTILLDEISEMELGLQAKLLRVLQEREVERLGGRKTIDLDVRVIATSNRNMQEQVANGCFREDLFYRLSVLPLQWLALRDRKADIIPIAESLLSKHASKQKRNGVVLLECARQALIQHPWPGNVRELDNVMQRALVLQPGNQISANDLGLNIGAFNQSAQLVEAPMVAQASSAQAQNLDMPDDLDAGVRRREFEIIAATLKEEKGSRKNTAERLGISPRTLRYKLARMREEGILMDNSLTPVM